MDGKKFEEIHKLVDKITDEALLKDIEVNLSNLLRCTDLNNDYKYNEYLCSQNKIIDDKGIEYLRFFFLNLFRGAYKTLNIAFKSGSFRRNILDNCDLSKLNINNDEIMFIANICNFKIMLYQKKDEIMTYIDSDTVDFKLLLRYKWFFEGLLKKVSLTVKNMKELSDENFRKKEEDFWKQFF